MSEHRAVVEWRHDAARDFAANRFSRAHRWSFDGGLAVAASASPHVVPPPLSDPAAVDPEEALVAAASSCHMLWFLSLAAARGVAVTSYRDHAVGFLEKDERGRLAITRIVLRPAIEFPAGPPSPEELDALHHEAHERCFIASSLRSEITVETPPA